MPVSEKPRQSSNAGQASGVPDDAVVPDQVLSRLNSLCNDAITGMYAMLEHGTREDRVAVFKALMPLIKEMGAESEGGTPAQVEARQILLGAWGEIAP